MTRKLTLKEIEAIDEVMKDVHAYVQPAQYPTESQAQAAAASEEAQKAEIRALLVKLVPLGTAPNHLLRYTKEFSVNNYQDAILSWLESIDAMISAVSPDNETEHDSIFTRSARFARKTSLSHATNSFNTLSEFKPNIGFHNIGAKLEQCAQRYEAQVKKDAVQRQEYYDFQTYISGSDLRQLLLKKDTKLLLTRTRSDSAAISKGCVFSASDVHPLRAHQPINVIGRGPR
ncbi:MAG: hypothetical protein JSR17_11570 [Proteobacteria bacterium]|nr:hypothetical protein [Pseudomonadota bacterium]